MARIVQFVLLFCFVGTIAATECGDHCKTRLRERVKICDDLFNSSGSAVYNDTQWHNGCLAEARTEFDNCLSTCNDHLAGVARLTRNKRAATGVAAR
jgi:hypothetical protein